MKDQELLNSDVLFPTSSEIPEGESVEYNLSFPESPNFSVKKFTNKKDQEFKLAFVNATLKTKEGKTRNASVLVNQDMVSVLESKNYGAVYGCEGVGKVSDSGTSYDQFTFRLDQFHE